MGLSLTKFTPAQVLHRAYPTAYSSRPQLLQNTG